MSIPQVLFLRGAATNAPSSVVRDLGILAYLYSNLSTTAHISKTVSNCFCAMRLIRSVRRSVSKAVLLSLDRQCDARGATCSTTLSAAVRFPCRCSDCFQCSEIRSRDAAAPRTPVTASWFLLLVVLDNKQLSTILHVYTMYLQDNI